MLLDYLKARTLIITGVAGNICVLFTANDAYMRDFNLVVPSDCCASNEPEENRHALEQIRKVLKADTTSSTALDLAALTIEVQAASDAVAAWALNNPSWRVYASGSLDAAGGSILPAAPAYLVVWVADDPSETDNNPAADTNEVILLHGLAVNGLGMRSAAQVTAQRTAGVIRILAWRRVR